MKDNVTSIDKAKKQQSLLEVLDSLHENSCDRNRPYIGLDHSFFGERGSTLVEGLTIRDIFDCIILGVLSCKQIDNNLPTIMVDKNGNKTSDYSKVEDSYIDPTKVKYKHIYLDGNVDHISAAQNAVCFIERRMGIFPNVKINKKE